MCLPTTIGIGMMSTYLLSLLLLIFSPATDNVVMAQQVTTTTSTTVNVGTNIIIQVAINA